MQRTDRIALVITLPLFACDPASELQFGVVDTPSPVPREADIVEPEGTKEVEAGPEAPDPEKVAECVPGTGRQPDGTCVVLRTRDQPQGQQVQLPVGTFVVGDIPGRYDARTFAEELRSRWSGNPPRLAPGPALWVDLHEVTHKAYAACVQAGTCTAAKCETGEDPATRFSPEVLKTIPQSCVTHEQAETYCGSVGGRLPTEVEWEFAARGSDARLYPWGNELRDEYRNTLLPVGGQVDTSYFGLRGMGSNATEWVADPFLLDAGLASFTTGSFRGPANPLAKLVADASPSWVVKGGKAGARQRRAAAHGLLGFRCAADLDAGVSPLDLPQEPRPVPLVTNVGSTELFGGVAEALTQPEAAAFCGALSVEWAGAQLTGWRLPSLAEVELTTEVFRGPGPFWTAEGAAEQGAGAGNRAPDAPWGSVAAKAGDLFAARCVRANDAD